MILNTITSAVVCEWSVRHAPLFLLNDRSKTWHGGTKLHRRSRTARSRAASSALERAQFLGKSLEKRSLCDIRPKKISRFRKLTVAARALEDRQPSLKRWNSKSTFKPSRWDTVKDHYNPKGQGRPRKPTSKTVVDDSRTAKGTDGRDDGKRAEAERIPIATRHAPREIEDEEILVSARQVGIRGAGRVLLREARKGAMYMKDKLSKTDVKKLFSTTVEATHATPFPPFTGSLIATVGAVMLFGLCVDMMLWKMSKGSGMNNVRAGTLSSNEEIGRGEDSLRSRAPSALSVLLDGDLRRKESVEWLNMIIGKLWNLYRRGLENWLVSLLQPIIDNLEKPDYVKKVQVKQFFLGDEPLSVRTVERRTSRRADDLQYHVGVRYTGGARLLLLITLKWGIFPLTIPVGVRGLDVDAEVWVKFRMIPTDPWVGQATWAFVTLPKIKLALAPFRLVNLMAIPFLSIFLAKLLTEDLPELFVRPNKNVVDFLQGRAVGPVSKDFKDGFFTDQSSFFTGELSVTLIECRKLSYIPYLKTDPYVIFVLGEQVVRSKKNSQTSIIGPPGAPVWNQDFKLLVVDQKTQHLSLTVHDTIGFTSYPVGSVDIDLTTLQDTVPVDRKLILKSGWGPLPKRFAGECILRLTYKAYIDEEGQEIPVGPGDGIYGNGNNELVGSAVEQVQEVATFFKEEAGRVAEFFQEKDLAKNMLSSLNAVTSNEDVERVLPFLASEKGNPSEDGMDLQEEVSSFKLLNEARSVQAAIATKAIDSEMKSTNKDSDNSLKATTEDKQVIIENQDGTLSEKVVPGEKDSQDKSAFVWFAALTGLILLVALDLNMSNILNP
ncbi:hypothetical protein MPTK1_3g15350 [Marchantia polymorpha subsp. ruderalis]|uniref:C2 domain-containing protein n=2 Tax=Marchantia polymorpha TaxID=3197 RepID=A0AAF6B123_MARPO|nr:hypothetical protein MARPO_0004s0137 [Marchantia polymorpha]BBN05707.1 hypothetical protein Mp_3g15350 [Marchantia polymorpha subsp. ruderalis]|eukprot:PTQ48874.1 hypothetical protein MARPO_0004s0137 [Marchantia polymorpha]